MIPPYRRLKFRLEELSPADGGPGFRAEWTGQLQRQPTAAGSILRDFAAISWGGLDAMHAFLAEYGPLPLCPDHHRPVPHRRDDVPGHVLCVQLPTTHPFRVYERFASEARALVQVAEAIRHYEASRGRSAWRTVMDDYSVEHALRLLRRQMVAVPDMEKFREYEATNVWPATRLSKLQESVVTKHYPAYVGDGERAIKDEEAVAKWINAGCPDGEALPVTEFPEGDTVRSAREEVAERLNFWLEHTGLQPHCSWPQQGGPVIAYQSAARDVAWNSEAWIALARVLVLKVTERSLSPAWRACKHCGAELPTQTKAGRPRVYCTTCTSTRKHRPDYWQSYAPHRPKSKR